MKWILLLGLIFSQISQSKEIDIKESVLYCVESASAGIEKGISTRFKPTKLVIKIKGDTVEISQRGETTVFYKHRNNFSFIEGNLYAYMLGGNLIVEIDKSNNSIKFNLFSHSNLLEDGSSVLTTSLGTCTKW